MAASLMPNHIGLARVTTEHKEVRRVECHRDDKAWAMAQAPAEEGWDLLHWKPMAGEKVGRWEYAAQRDVTKAQRKLLSAAADWLEFFRGNCLSSGSLPPEAEAVVKDLRQGDKAP